MADKTHNNLTAMDDYINRVYKLVLLLIPGACECAGLCYTFAKVINWIPEVSWTALIIFDITCIIYLGIGILLIKTSERDGVVKPGSLLAGKIFLIALMLIQFNFIVYMIPATDFWGFAFFFVILTAFFLDWKIVAISAVEVGGSIVVAWFIRGDIHLPARDEHFAINMTDRVVCLALSLVSIVLFTLFISKFLVNAKKDEMERNIDQVKSVLSGVQSLSENLNTAGASLSQISERESTAANRLALTSQQLLNSSNMLSAKTSESTSILSELSRWQGVVSDNVQKVENASNELLEKSTANQKVVSDLHTINGEVSESMKATNDVAGKLSDAVREIGTTLKLISDISSTTNILSINASIEAARAGEAGRGFAVVAFEIGKLANNTQESLKMVQAVIKRIQENMSTR